MEGLDRRFSPDVLSFRRSIRVVDVSRDAPDAADGADPTGHAPIPTLSRVRLPALRFATGERRLHGLSRMRRSVEIPDFVSVSPAKFYRAWQSFINGSSAGDRPAVTASNPHNNRRFRPGGRNYIIDARKREVVMLEPGDLPPGVPHQLRSAVARANEHRLWPVLKACAICLVIQVLMSRGFSALKNPGEFILPTTAMLLLWVLLSLWASRFTVRRKAEAAVDACLRDQICPSCGYSLIHTCSEQDSCTVCPECGAAWKLSTSPQSPPKTSTAPGSPASAADFPSPP